ncbi:MAG: cell division protein FtsA [Bdellovibrionales bacterium]|nr:cell division protein FtsA [Bdellovibrionales bacterium]
MAPKNNHLVALDIGTSSISAAIAELREGQTPHLIGIGTTPSRGLRKGVVINIEATVESIRRAVEQAETMAGIQANSVFASISGSHIQGLNSNGIVGIRNKEVSHYDIEKVIDAAKAVAIPLDREVLHVLPQEFIIDNQDGIREPLGISGVRLEARVHIVTGSVASAQNVVKCANRCGLTVKDIVLSPLAASASVLSDEERELGVALVDIGGGTTDIIVYHGGSVRHTAVLAVGGSHITNDIAAGLRTPIGAAEDIKQRYASAVADQNDGVSTLEVASTGGRAPRILSQSMLGEIVEPRVQEIFRLVKRELERVGCVELLTSGIVLTGGSSRLKRIGEVAESVFQLPVRIGEPTGISGVTDLIRGPEFSTVAGLILFSSRRQNFSNAYRGQSVVGRTFRNVSNWLSEHF